MLDLFKRSLIASFTAATFLAAPAFSADAPVKEAPRAGATEVKPPEVKPATPRPKESATDPKPRDANWMKRHDRYLEENKANAGKVDVLFVGDSITDGWHGQKKLWEETWTPMKTWNIGIGGDRTQHVIWRLQNGEVAGISPKVTMLMIGTNNLGGNSNDEIIAGIKGCVDEIKKQMPTTKILLLGVFPRGAKAEDPNRARIKAINVEIAKWDDGGKTIKYLDFGDKFLEADGTMPKAIMNDFLHPTTKGYEIWIEAVKPVIEAMKK